MVKYDALRNAITSRSMCVSDFANIKRTSCKYQTTFAAPLLHAVPASQAKLELVPIEESGYKCQRKLGFINKSQIFSLGTSYDPLFCEFMIYCSPTKRSQTVVFFHTVVP